MSISMTGRMLRGCVQRPKRSGDAVHEYNNAHGHASYSSANWWGVAWTSYSVQLLRRG